LGKHDCLTFTSIHGHLVLKRTMSSVVPHTRTLTYGTVCFQASNDVHISRMPAIALHGPSQPRTLAYSSLSAGSSIQYLINIERWLLAIASATNRQMRTAMCVDSGPAVAVWGSTSHGEPGGVLKALAAAANRSASYSVSGKPRQRCAFIEKSSIHSHHPPHD